MKYIVLFLFAVLTARADNLRVLGVNESLGQDDIISIVSLAPGTSGLWLEGRQIDDQTGVPVLGRADRGPNSVTRWKVIEPNPGILAFQCLGFPDGAVWMNGYTRSGEVVLALSPYGVSGAGWGFYREGTGVNLKCLGAISGKRWLVAVAPDRVAMELEADGVPSLWQIYVWKKGSPAEKKAGAVK